MDIIAHRGASAYLPEHSMAAKLMAYGMGADYLEQDIVASRDGELLVLHDIYLDFVSDVAARFPDRARADGHYYCIDFDLDEIRSLRCGERIDPATGEAVYPSRFPPGVGDFRVSTLDEEIRVVRALNRATGRQVGIYPEIKDPAWHRENGVELGDRLLAVLEGHGYLKKNQRIFIQCYDYKELIRVREKAGPAVPTIQLIGSRDLEGISPPETGERLREIAAYATGIGPSLSLVYLGPGPGGAPRLSTLVGAAHDVGLVVHPYTFRADALPPGIGDFEALIGLFVERLGVDGLFTDFPDRVSAYLGRRSGAQSRPQ